MNAAGTPQNLVIVMTALRFMALYQRRSTRGNRLTNPALQAMPCLRVRYDHGLAALKQNCKLRRLCSSKRSAAATGIAYHCLFAAEDGGIAVSDRHAPRLTTCTDERSN